MIKPILVLAAAMIAVPAMAQAPAAGALPMCSAKVKDGCQQTPGQEARAMSGEQADKRDAKSGGWAPNKGGSDKDAMAPMKKPAHKAHHKAAAKPMAAAPAAEAAPK